MEHTLKFLDRAPSIEECRGTNLPEHASTCARTSTHTHSLTHTQHTHTRTHTHTHIHTHTNMHTHTHTPVTCARTHTHTHTHTHRHTHTRTHTHTLLHKRTHTRTHTYTHMLTNTARALLELTDNLFLAQPPLQGVLRHHFQPMAGRKPMSGTTISFAVSLAILLVSVCMYYGNVIVLFKDIPTLIDTMAISLFPREPDLVAYTCLSPDGSEDFKLLVEELDRGGANVHGVGLGTFDGMRGLQVGTGTNMRTHAHTHKHARAHTQTRTHTHMSAHMHTRTYTRICDTHTQAHTYTHTHAHAYAHTP